MDTDTDEARKELEDLITSYSGRAIPIDLLPTVRGRGDERAQGEEIIQPVKEALGDAFDEAVLRLQPQIEMQNILDMETEMGNVVETVDVINTTDLYPQVIDDDLKAIHEEARLFHEELGSIVTDGPYFVDMDSNLDLLNADLDLAVGKLDYLTGPHYMTIFTRHEDIGMGGTSGASGGGQGGNDGPGGSAPVTVNFNGTSPQENMRYLQDRGILPRTTFR